MKKSIRLFSLLMAIVLALFGVSNGIYADGNDAAPANEKQFKTWKQAFTNVDEHKVWTITFLWDVDPKSLVEENIYVEDTAGNKVDVKFNVLESEKYGKRKVTITPPEDGYEAGKTYNLIIKGVKSSEGHELVSAVKMTFSVKNSAAITDLNYFTYEDYPEQDGVQITGYSDEGPKDVVIPKTINGKNVVVIGESAFAEKGIKSVEIPSTVLHIYPKAFISNEISEVLIKNTECVYINAFDYSVRVNRINKELKYTDDGFGYSIDNLNGVVVIKDYNGMSQEITIPSKLEGMQVEIGQAAFLYKSLKSVTIEEGVSRLGRSAFSCNTIEELKLPKSLLVIGPHAFSYNKLKALTINSIRKIDSYAFSHNELTSINFAGNFEIIGSEAFSNNNLTQIVIPEGVKSIEGAAFARNQLTSVTLPSTLEKIQMFGFVSNNLTEVEVPSGCEVEDSVFDEGVVIKKK